MHACSLHFLNTKKYTVSSTTKTKSLMFGKVQNFPMVKEEVKSRSMNWTQVSSIPKSIYIRVNQIASAIFKSKQIFRTSFKLATYLKACLHSAIAKAFPSLCKKGIIIHINHLVLNRDGSSPVFPLASVVQSTIVVLEGWMADGGQHV